MKTTSALGEWRDQIGRHLLRLDFEPSASQAFRASIEPLLVTPTVRLVRCRLSGGKVYRDKHLARQGDASFTFLIASRRLSIQHQARDVDLLPGEATVLRDFEAGNLVAESGVGFVAITVPAGAAAGVLDSVGPGSLVPRHCKALQLLRAYIGSMALVELGGGTLLLNDEIERHLLELVQLSLKQPTGDVWSVERRPVQAVKFAEILRQIELRHSEPDLTPDLVACSVGISRRHLFGLLSSSGRTFSQRLLDTRLATAHARLMADNSHLISDIALDSGFSDLSYFNRCFRERYRMCPRDVRRDGATIKSQVPTG
jgi:AraC-like DNA-binding protein